ncbi:Hsp20/alpha crystallin family protein [Zavarzinia sp.]|uniref:Hsp20/alpha crystallin family protein n=1 Tax=Zavarzinia sp. TaxID=2027920 RepID=UPI003563A0FE
MNVRTLLTRGGMPMATARDANPFRALQREMERLFNDFAVDMTPMAMMTEVMPKLDVTETADAIKVTAELPGLEEKDVEITLANDMLTIRGEKNVEHEDKGETRHVVERATGTFARAIQVPAGMDPAAVKATMDKGVLTVTMPKPAAAPAAQKIEVTRAA